ncbi:MAG: hypothetical protein HC812_13575 [Leptolyngbya sp. RL_3_1]|nr:hypothetical protein [Leptolyngbya sp. RL_3_1]
MYTLSPFTCNRLHRLPKHPVVWEGDRRPISEGMLSAFGYESEDLDEDGASDCILWVDGTEGVLRAVTIIPADTGPEAVARTLLQAMEHPQGAMPPARPQKLVVGDREIQFFLRGALQNLDLTIDYEAKLPVIDDIFESLQQHHPPTEVTLPPDWRAAINGQAQKMWDNAPWNYLSDYQIIGVTLNHWSIETLYVSVLGMAGMEYGLLLYRSESALQQFREMALQPERTPQQMQQAFLSQDCLFLNFELIRDQGEQPVIALPWMQSAPSGVEPDFGSLHPLEGLRHILELEEAAALRISLEALNRFFEANGRKLSKAPFPAVKATYTLTDPITEKPLKVKVATETEVTAALGALDEAAAVPAAGDLGKFPVFRDDYVPEGALILMARFSADDMAKWRSQKFYQALPDTPAQGDLPILVIQTSRPKAKVLAQQLQKADGVVSVCFNPGRDPMTGEQFHLGLIKTGDGEFHLCVEFSEEDPEDRRLVQRWQKWHQQYQGHCGVMVASGVTGVSRGKPGIKEALAFFETRSQTPEELGLPPLQMSYALDWE